MMATLALGLLCSGWLLFTNLQYRQKNQPNHKTAYVH
jgi:hypothetical protein